MGLKQCDKCSEMVDEVKAFCPGCGNAFIEEEKRELDSSFDRLDHTVQLGQTAYNLMLSDMGLNISEAPNAADKRVELIEPIQPEASEPQQAAVELPEKTLDKNKPVGNSKVIWVVLSGVVMVFLFLLVLAAAILLFLFWPGLRQGF